MLMNRMTGRSWPVAIMLCAAGSAAGLAGCAAPAITSSGAAERSVFSRFGDRFVSEPDVGRARYRSMEQRLATTAAIQRVSDAIAADDPFSDDPFSVVQTASDSRPAAGESAPVTVGIANVSDGRLPPAAPLGATNPFPRESGPVGRDGSATEDARSTQPTFRNASRQREIAGEGVPHDDMIVESAVVPKRAIWRFDSRPHPSDSRTVDHTVVSRKPFVTAAKLESESPAIATANRSVEIMPDGSVENFEAAVLDLPAEPDDRPAADDSAVVAEKDDARSEAVAEAPPPPVDEALVPIADPAFSDTAPVFADEAPAARETAQTTPGDSPRGPTLAMAPGRSAPPPPTVASTAPTPLAIHSGRTSVTPIPVDAGDREAARIAASRSRFSMNRPVAIGLVLAFVASSVVIIRRRFI